MQNIVDKLKLQCNRESTRRNYYSVWKQFNEFYIKLDVKPNNWEDRIILFAGYMIDQKKKSTTVKSYVSGIKAILKEDGFEINENRYLLTCLTRACKYKNDTVRTRLPIQKGMLNIIIKETYKYFLNANQPFLAKLYSALYSTAYYGMFRIGELTTGDHPVLAVDVHVAENKKKMLFILRTSKTHWRDTKPQQIKISAVQDKPHTDNYLYNRKIAPEDITCPFEILQRYVKARPTCKRTDEPFFVFSDRSPVKPWNMRNTMNNILRIQGFESNLYGVHSYRIGHAHDLLNLGISISVIKNLGRWRSNAVYSYLR